MRQIRFLAASIDLLPKDARKLCIEAPDRGRVRAPQSPVVERSRRRPLHAGVCHAVWPNGCSTADRGIREIVLGGVPLHLDVGEWTTTGRHFANVTYEPATVRYLQTHLAERDVFVDVGANSG